MLLLWVLGKKDVTREDLEKMLQNLQLYFWRIRYFIKIIFYRVFQYLTDKLAEDVEVTKTTRNRTAMPGRKCCGCEQ